METTPMPALEPTLDNVKEEELIQSHRHRM